MTELGEPDSGESSICCSHENAPIVHHWYRIAEEPTMLERFRELLADEGLSESERDIFVGEFKARMRALEAGVLMPIHQVKGPMRGEKRLSIFELRWRFTKRNGEEIRIRAYHVEPKSLQSPHGSVVVGLHMHKKDTEAADVSDAQDQEIKIAADRFYRGRAQNWGL